MSRFDALAKRQGPRDDVAPGTPAVSRRGNPGYRQFSAYIPLDLYRKLKVQLAQDDLDLSAAVEHAISDWLQKKTGK